MRLCLLRVPLICFRRCPTPISISTTKCRSSRFRCPERPKSELTAGLDPRPRAKNESRSDTFNDNVYPRNSKSKTFNNNRIQNGAYSSQSQCGGPGASAVSGVADSGDGSPFASMDWHCLDHYQTLSGVHAQQWSCTSCLFSLHPEPMKLGCQ